MFNISSLLSSVATDAIGLRGKRGRRARGFLGGGGRSFLGTSSLIGLAGLAVGAYHIFKSSSQSSARQPVQPGTRVVDAAGRELDEFPARAATPPVPSVTAPSQSVDDMPLRAMRIMIAAARCDGQLGEEKLGELISHAKDAGIEAQMRSEWQAPRSLAELCAGVSDPAQQSDLYILAFAVLRADEELTGAERVFLAQLAARLGLSKEQAVALESDTARRIDLSS
jgi:uncharacterized membrane protein YebE (DUF533 family)